MSAPKIVKTISEVGEITDELDYALMTYLMKNRGAGYTPCQPQLVELDNGKHAIRMNLDNTFIGKNNQLMGLGIVGKLLIDEQTLGVIYCTPLEEMQANMEKLKKAGYEPQERPRGKY